MSPWSWPLVGHSCDRSAACKGPRKPMAMSAVMIRVVVFFIEHPPGHLAAVESLYWPAGGARKSWKAVLGPDPAGLQKSMPGVCHGGTRTGESCVAAGPFDLLSCVRTPDR